MFVDGVWFTLLEVDLGLIVWCYVLMFVGFGLSGCELAVIAGCYYVRVGGYVCWYSYV